MGEKSVGVLGELGDGCGGKWMLSLRSGSLGDDASWCLTGFSPALRSGQPSSILRNAVTSSWGCSLSAAGGAALSRSSSSGACSPHICMMQSATCAMVGRASGLGDQQAMQSWTRSSGQLSGKAKPQQGLAGSSLCLMISAAVSLQIGGNIASASDLGQWCVSELSGTSAHPL
jgi:hypothetical protein